MQLDDGGGDWSTTTGKERPGENALLRGGGNEGAGLRPLSVWSDHTGWTQHCRVVKLDFSFSTGQG